ncbi:MAG TPA: uroporphyrinogen-III C-methyltransferase [Mycobacteriales bacterium]|nr:uroporphyrinogen-III C-methyltransferase [Mycobacteriales bacterium]
MRYPIFLDLTGRRVVVVGGGRVASRRVSGLVDAHADVVVVAPSISPEIADLAVERRERAYADGDVDGAWLVFACTDDPGVNAQVSTAAQARGVWCVRADDAASSAAWRPAVAEVDELTVAVSASGDPARAAELRDLIGNGLRSGSLAPRRHRGAAGRVTLVGGGPGDPDLLTVKGLRALQDADVVVTDRLGPTGLLGSLDAQIEVVDVGKTPGGHAAEQADINALLVARAQAGQRVVRLKGGDSFVLGRGSEEVDACRAAGVEVEVVPGVTSATAAAALAGIALTERGTTQQFVVASGHVPPGDARSTVEWATLAATNATLVLLMAVGNLEAIAATLIEGGRSPDCGAAVVENASLPQQRVVRARLADLAGAARAAGVKPPAVLIVGDVVRLT